MSYPDTLEVEGLRFTCMHMPAKQASSLLFRCGKTIGAIKLRNVQIPIDMAFAVMLEQGDVGAYDALEDAMVSVCKVQLASTTPIVPLSGAYEDAFKGRHILRYQWLRFAVEYNFGDFLAAGLNVTNAASASARPVQP